MRHAVAVLVILLPTAAPALADHAPRSRYFFGMGLVVRSAPSELGNLGGLRHDSYVARTIETPQALLDLDVGFRWRAGFQLGPALFVALDTGFGVVELPEGPQMSAPFRQGSSATMLGVAGLGAWVGSVDVTFRPPRR